MSTGAFTAALLAAALLPGAVFQWGFERRAGRFGLGLRDRSLRIASGSAFILAVYATPLYWLHTNYWAQFRDGALPIWIPTALSVVYLGLPLAGGWCLGWGVSNGTSWAKFLVRNNRIPTAWDYMFSAGATGWVRCKLKSGVWVAGAYARESNGISSYASGYPEDHELYLSPLVVTNPNTGAFVYDDDQSVCLDVGGLWLQAGDIEMINFIKLRTERR